MKKLVAVVTALCLMATALVGCGSPKAEPVEIQADVARLAVKVGETRTLDVAVSNAPEGAEVNWDIGDEGIATVDAGKGTVTGVAAGETDLTIQVDDADGKLLTKDSIKVVVSEEDQKEEEGTNQAESTDSQDGNDLGGPTSSTEGQQSSGGSGGGGGTGSSTGNTNQSSNSTSSQSHTPAPAPQPQPEPEPEPEPQPPAERFTQAEINSIVASAIAYGKSLGMTHDPELTIDNGSWHQPLMFDRYDSSRGLEYFRERAKELVKMEHDLGFEFFTVVAGHDYSVSDDWIIYVPVG